MYIFIFFKKIIFPRFINIFLLGLRQDVKLCLFHLPLSPEPIDKRRNEIWKDEGGQQISHVKCSYVLGLMLIKPQF